MTLMLELPAETEAQLREKAAREGLDAASVAVSLLADALERDLRDWEEAVEGIAEGLADSTAGRVTPLAEWDARMRSKHGIPAEVSPAEAE